MNKEIEQIMNPENWKLRNINSQLKDVQERRTDDSAPTNIWRNTSKQISPLTLYKYLKTKFGDPNGFVMFLKNRTSDNLIHWQYSFQSSDAKIHIWGKTSGLEIIIKLANDQILGVEDWLLLENNFIAQFKQLKKTMSETQSTFEQWALFINPFTRLETTLQDNISKLQKLNLKEPETAAISKESLERYNKELKRWIANINKAASLGTTIRMLCPVMAEAFVNLVLLVFRKDEYREDERLYDSLLRQQIDVRVKTLHFHCTSFSNQIDIKSEAFKKFQTLMNQRNDFLHGNIDPKRLIVERVWFDNGNIPLFEDDEGVIKKMLRHYCANVEPEKAIKDFDIVSGLIELVLVAMDEDSLRKFVQIMADRMPGINEKNNRLAVLFNTEHLAESYAF